MKIGGDSPKSVIKNSCFVAKVLAGVLLLVGVLNAGMTVSRGPTDGKHWLQALTMLLLVMGTSLMVLLTYDVLCKAGYERTILVAFGLIVAAMVLSSIAGL